MNLYRPQLQRRHVKDTEHCLLAHLFLLPYILSLDDLSEVPYGTYQNQEGLFDHLVNFHSFIIYIYFNSKTGSFHYKLIYRGKLKSIILLTSQ